MITGSVDADLQAIIRVRVLGPAGRAILADGSETLFEVYEAAIVWDGRLRSVPVSIADTDPLVGMSLLLGHELTVQVIADGSVRIAAIERQDR